MRSTTALAACLLAWASAAPAWATANGADYNNAFKTGDISDCVHPKQRTGIAGFAFDGTYVPFKFDYLNAQTRWPGCEHAPGSIRVLKLQTLRIAGRTTYMTRGGTAEGEGFPGKPHVHIAAAELQRAPRLLNHRARERNGRSAPNCSLPIHARPTALPDAMKYRPGEPPESGATWSNYGNPGARYGANYFNLLWNLPRRDVNGSELEVNGGGILMATVKPRQRLLVCDVSQQLLDSFAPGGSTINGWTQWVYVAAQNGALTLHGWAMVRAHHNGTTYQLFD